jgi:hypothetical protein
MGIIGMSSKEWDGIESKLGGFSLCPEGSGLLFEITAHREGTYKKGDDDIEYVTLACSYTDDDGIKHDHWEFFNLLEKDMPYLKGFLEKIERHDLLANDDAEWEDIYGTAFTADIKHRTNKKSGDKASNMLRNTITAVSHEEGKEVKGWQAEIGLETEEEEEAPKTKTSATRTGKKKAPKEEPEDDDVEDGEDEEDEAPPKRSRRRTRRGERED